GIICSPLTFAQTKQNSMPGKSAVIRNRALITLPATQNSTTSGRTVNLQFPQGTKPESVKAVLNGKDVSSEFHPMTCSGGVCLTAILTETDGLRDGNNVLYATAKNEDGTASSSRMHFDGVQPTLNSGGVRRLNFSHGANATSAATTLPTLSSFIPPI